MEAATFVLEFGQTNWGSRCIQFKSPSYCYKFDLDDNGKELLSKQVDFLSQLPDWLSRFRLRAIEPSDCERQDLVNSCRTLEKQLRLIIFLLESDHRLCNNSSTVAATVGRFQPHLRLNNGFLLDYFITLHFRIRSLEYGISDRDPELEVEKYAERVLDCAEGLYFVAKIVQQLERQSNWPPLQEAVQTVRGHLGHRTLYDQYCRNIDKIILDANVVL